MRFLTRENPLRVVYSAVRNTRYILDVTGIHYQNRETTRLKDVHDRPPITPVLSMAAWIMPSANRHSFHSVNNHFVNWDVRVSGLIPVPLTTATISFLCTPRSHPRSATSSKLTACFCFAIVLKEYDTSVAG